MTTSAPRAPIDFDAFERDLRQASLPQGDSAAAATNTAKGDPLAELARIVGQDDPFRALLQAHQMQGGERQASGQAVAQQGHRQGHQQGRIEPSFLGAGHETAVSPADAFDQYLASVEQQDAYAEGREQAHGHNQSHDHAQDHEGGQDPAAFEDAPAAGYRAFGYGALLAKRPRRQLVQVGAGLGVLVLCVTGALGWKAMRPRGSDGGPVTVLADRTPLKVAPTAADGVEIPDQNKQIYDRNAKDGQIKVVNREEQPLDVAQAARAGRDNAGSSGATTPGNTALLTDSLGAPRRVRTVSVKPDAPPASVRADAPQRDAQREAPPRETQVASAEPVVGRAPPSPIPTMTMPDAGASPDAQSQAQPRRPSRTLASTNTATNSQAKPAPAAESPAAAETPAAQPATGRRKANQRVASLAPEASAPAEDTAAAPQASAEASPVSTASTTSVGGYSVQLGVRNSESDAQAAFKQMQDKYSQLAGKPALIRHADVDGKSLYRVRVGPLAKAEASSLCTALKGAGGQCFVAKN